MLSQGAEPLVALAASGRPLTGPLHWWRSYTLLLRWELLNLRLLLPLLIVVQFFIGAGLVIGLGFLFDEIPRAQALYLATGGAVVSLLTVGMVMAPQVVAQHKTARTYDFMLSLPVPRVALALAALTVWVAIALPGMVLALGAAAWWYQLDLQVSWLVVPAALLTVLVGTSVGFAFAHASPNPQLTTLVTQVLVFVILVYSPVNFPAERLPGWLATAHVGLPFEHAANVIRGSLTRDLGDGLGLSFAILAAWTAAGWSVTHWVLERRR